MSDYSNTIRQGTPDQIANDLNYPWLKMLANRKDIYCHFYANWQSIPLPDGYDYYLVVYKHENVDLDWIKRQHVKGKIVVVFPGNAYDVDIPNVEFVGYAHLHKDLGKMIDMFGIHPSNPHKNYKFSIVCNRVTQSKIWVTTKLLESETDSLIILNTKWIEGKNVHNWNPTGVSLLDNLTRTFKEKYVHLNLTDDFDKSSDNHFNKNANPWQPLYTDTALHIVGGSFHYSYMGDYTYPGPDIDEKTLKCLLAGVPFLPAMQFDVYNYLSEFGLRFDYGFDTSFDADSGNLTRFVKLCKLIDKLSKWSIEEIISATADATEHNKQHIISGKFAEQCDQYNEIQTEKILKALQ